MAKFKLKDKHVAFCNAVAGGMHAREAYIKYMAVNEKVTKASASVTATRLMARPEIKDCIERARLKREEEITGEMSRQIDPVFKTIALTLDELDAYHYAIIQGKVTVEEVVPQVTITEVLGENGKIVRRQKQQTFVRVQRPPNVREKQISIDAMYKRHGNYAPSKLFGAFKNIGDDEPEDNVERFVMLSDGKKIPLLPEKKKAS